MTTTRQQIDITEAELDQITAALSNYAGQYEDNGYPGRSSDLDCLGDELRARYNAKVERAALVAAVGKAPRPRQTPAEQHGDEMDGRGEDLRNYGEGF